MNDFVVTIDGHKKNLKVINEHLIILDEKEFQVELSKVNEHLYLIKVGNKVYEVTSSRINSEKYNFLVYGRSYEATVRTTLQEKANEFLSQKERLSHHDVIKAPMPGMILKVSKSVGDTVEIGEPVLILEAMKMENELRSPASGIIKEVHVKEGSSVEKDTVLLSIE